MIDIETMKKQTRCSAEKREENRRDFPEKTECNKQA